MNQKILTPPPLESLAVLPVQKSNQNQSEMPAGKTAKKAGGQGNIKHGKRGTSEYKIWECMKHRCSSQRNKRWLRYGGRGICVCDRWKNSFVLFFEDMGMRPSKDHTLDRINNDGNYEPENCRWATKFQQYGNRSDNHNVTWNGITKHVAQWSRETDINVETLYYRLRHGWTVERALTTPGKGA